MKNTRRLTKRRREQPTTQLHPVELATLVEASGATDRYPADADAETVEMVPLEAIGIEDATADPPIDRRNAKTQPPPGVARDSVARDSAETEEVIELARGSSQVPPPIVTARGPRRSRSRIPKLTR